jgi:hypothetical protein
MQSSFSLRHGRWTDTFKTRNRHQEQHAPTPLHWSNRSLIDIGHIHRHSMNAAPAGLVDDRLALRDLIVLHTDKNRCVGRAQVSPRAGNARCPVSGAGQCTKKRIDILIVDDGKDKFP